MILWEYHQSNSSLNPLSVQSVTNSGPFWPHHICKRPVLADNINTVTQVQSVNSSIQEKPFPEHSHCRCVSLQPDHSINPNKVYDVQLTVGPIGMETLAGLSVHLMLWSLINLISQLAKLHTWDLNSSHSSDDFRLHLGLTTETWLCLRLHPKDFSSDFSVFAS